jgi:glucose-1-phosphate cytidylyltransferase
MKTVILAGGLGTRLSEETTLKPKPMVEIGNVPILVHIMRYYMKYNFNDFIILAGYKHQVVKEYFLNYVSLNNDIIIDTSKSKVQIINKKKENFRVTILNTGEDSNTGGRLLRAKKLLQKENNFLMTYGDGLSNVDLKKLINEHKKNKKICTLTAVNPSGKFGDLSLKGNIVEKFNEKPISPNNWVNGGYFVINKKIFNYLENDKTILEADALAALSKDKELGYYKHYGFWKPMDTLNDKNMLNKLWYENKAPWKIS